MSNDWITDRRPDPEKDGRIVYRFTGHTIHCSCIRDGEAWKPIPQIEPYVKPKKWTAEYRYNLSMWVITDKRDCTGAIFTLLRENTDEHREAAERIAAIYEEVMP